MSDETKPEYCNGCGMPHTGLCPRKVAEAHAESSLKLYEGMYE